MVFKFPVVGERYLRGLFLPKRFGPIRVLLSCCAITAVIVATSTGLVVLSTYENRLGEVRSQLKKLSSVLADDADRMFEALDLVERRVLAELPPGDITPEGFTRLMAGELVHEQLSERIVGLPQVVSLSIVSNQADLVNSSKLWPTPRANASDRDYFNALSRTGGPDVYISKPVASYVTGMWSIFFARRITSQRGEFLGLIVIAVELDRLEKFFSGIATDRGDAISMLRTDGVLLARFPALVDKMGQQAAGNAVIVNPKSPREFQRLVSVWDGQDRFVATARSTTYPIIMNVSTTASSAFERWKRQTWFLVAAATLLELGIVAVALAGFRALQGRLRLSQERANRSRLIAEAEIALARERENAAEERSARDRRFRVAIETMRQGLCMFDGDETLLLYNHRVAIDLGIPVERLTPGLPLRSLVALLEEHGAIDADGADRFQRSLSGTQAERDTDPTIETLRDGRILAFTVRAMSQDSGWVLTCEDVTDRHKAEQRLLHIALHDPLTNLANRNGLRNRIEAEVRRIRSRETGAVLYIDLDGFKEVNDSLGHPAGDAVLQTVAERLVRSTRNADTVARIGGDEFVIVQSSLTHPESAVALAERVIVELRTPFEVSGHRIALGASVGVAFIEPGDSEPDLFIKNADLALYEAKKDGGNCFRVFEPRLQAAANAKSTLCAELKAAVINREFVVHYQPQVTIQTRTLCGFEALVRWQHPTRGLVAPGEFINLAEELGLIGQIGQYVLIEACAEAATWSLPLKIAVNLSPKQFGSHQKITDTVYDALSWSGLDPGRLELEITESTLLQGDQDTLTVLHSLKDLGVRISMDDFGIGYSSLSYLQRFPFDRVKIDQSFIRNMDRDADGDPIIHAVASLCAVLGIRTTAEGVETERQFEQLAREGCSDAQGFLFGRASPANTVENVIRRSASMRVADDADIHAALTAAP